MMWGVPKVAIHSRRMVLATVFAEMSLIGTAVGHLENRSTIVNKYWKSWHIGRGPTRSTCMCENLASGLAKVPTGDFVWR